MLPRELRQLHTKACSQFSGVSHPDNIDADVFAHTGQTLHSLELDTDRFVADLAEVKTLTGSQFPLEGQP